MIKGRAASGMFTDLTIIGGKMVVKGSSAAKSAEAAVVAKTAAQLGATAAAPRPLKVLQEQKPN